MIGNIGANISIGTAISSANTTISAAHTMAKESKSNHDSHRMQIAYHEDRTLNVALTVFGIFFLAVSIMMIMAYGPETFAETEIHAGKLNAAAVEQARQRELDATLPKPTYLYSQKVPTKILFIGSHKHVRVRVRNQATGAIDSIYLCKKYCGLDANEPDPGSIVNITWHSYRGKNGIFELVDEGEILKLYR